MAPKVASSTVTGLLILNLLFFTMVSSHKAPCPPPPSHPVPKPPPSHKAPCSPPPHSYPVPKPPPSHPVPTPPSAPLPVPTPPSAPLPVPTPPSAPLPVPTPPSAPLPVPTPPSAPLPVPTPPSAPLPMPTPPSAPLPVPTPPSTPLPMPTPPSAPPPKNPTCPDTLTLGVCANLLKSLLSTIQIGQPPKTPCCSLIGGLTDLEAALCLCTVIKANILGITVNVPVSLSLLLNYCGKGGVPSGFQCPQN